MRFNIYAVMLTLWLAIIGCSGSGDPASPPLAVLSQNRETKSSGDHCLLGFFLISGNSADNSLEIIPVRGGSEHYNVLSFLEKGPCTNCVKIAGISPGPDNSKYIDINITHPFPGTNLTGFDVRGIVMFDGSLTFEESQLVTSDSSVGDGQLLNAEGFTTLYNPFTWGSGPNGWQGYFQGKFASVDIPSSTLNGYMRHVSDYPGNTRNALFGASSVTRTYQIVFPQGDFILGYAVDASWAPPDNYPVVDPMTDFPISANCPEPWKLDFCLPPQNGGLSNNGGWVEYQVDVYDWQGSTTHDEPVIECNPIFDGIKTAEFVSEGAGFSTWRFGFENEKLAPAGTYKALLSVEDNENISSPDYLDLTAYRVVDLVVHGGAWAVSWGGEYNDFPNDIVTDSDGNIYVTGYFYETVDFDPGEDILEHTTAGYEDAYLSKFDPDGNLIWNRVWGAEYHEGGEGITLDSSGNIYVAGYFNNTVDFDPGPGVTEHTSHGDWDSFISKFSPEGDYIWSRAWGSNMWDKALDVSCDDSQNVYLCGFFRGTCDFNPEDGPSEEDIWEFNPGASYITSFGENGDHRWAKAWAGDGSADDVARALVTDSFGNSYISGTFDGTVDLDPGNGVESFTAPSIYPDAYTSCFDNDGEFVWGYGWGAESEEIVRSMALDGNDFLYLAGNFLETVDFDPTSGVDNHTALEDRDAFLTKYTTVGDYVRTVTWGGGNAPGSDNEIPWDCDVAPDSTVIVSGTFNNTVDFDPSPDSIEEYTSAGMNDVFISAFDMDGGHLWTHAFGSSIDDYGSCVSADLFGNFYLAGTFNETVDFNPYSNVYELTSNGYQDDFLVKYLPNGIW